MVESSGVFQSTAMLGSYVLTHNASKLSTHEYYMAERAGAISLIFSGDLPAVLSPAIHDYNTKATRIQSHVLMKYLMYSIERSQRWCICSMLNLRENALMQLLLFL